MPSFFDIDYVVNNWYTENVAELMKPLSFIKLFDGTKQKKIVEQLQRLKRMRLR